MKLSVKDMTLTQLRQWEPKKAPSDKAIREMRFSGIVIVPRTRLHDSGWRLIKVIGVQWFKPVAVLSHVADAMDLEQHMIPGAEMLGFKLDILPRSNCVHLWSRLSICNSGSIGISNVDLSLVQGRFNG